MCSRDRHLHRTYLGWVGAGLLLMLACGAPVADDGGSAVVGAFAEIEPGGRGAALGGALGPIADGPAAAYWNPARLVTIEGPAMELAYADLFGLDLVRHTSLFVAFPQTRNDHSWKDGKLSTRRTPWFAWGLGLQSTQVDLDPETYSEHDFSLTLSHQGIWGLRYGGVVHLLLVRSDLENISANGASYDVALNRPIGAGFEASLILRSLFSNLSWKDSLEETLTPRAHIGLSFSPSSSWRIPVEALYELEQEVLRQMSGGIEWAPMLGSRAELLTLRAGVRWRDDGDETELLPAGGVGLGWQKIRFDYGFATGREGLGDTHRMGLCYRF